MVLFDYALWFAFTALCGSLVGILALKRVLDAWKRTSPIVLTLASVIGLATIVVISFGCYNQISAYYNGTANWSFRSLC
jgi:multidrug transporter EmrE-like cation transporter